MLSITPDQLSSAGSYIAREWGDHGYVVENITAPIRLVTLFHVRASDGSRFVVAVDCWGNCRDVEYAGIGPAERAGAVIDVVREMHAAASAA
jgi:hypothetical protein